jgi:hypothetical protein
MVYLCSEERYSPIAASTKSTTMRMSHHWPEEGRQSGAKNLDVKRTPDEEVEIWWGGCAVRTIAPSFVLSLVLTVALVAVASRLGAWRDEVIVRYATRVALVGIWLLQAGVSWYRLTAINYRLTTRRLIIGRDFSLGAPPDPGILLRRVHRVLVERTFLDSLLKVGSVRVVTEDGDQTSFVLSGLREPMRVAAMIRRYAKRSRQSNGTS